MANVTKDSKQKKKFKKKGNFKTRRDTEFKSSADEGKFEQHPQCNDVDWYTVSPQLLSDAGSLSFVNPLGNSLRVTELTQFDSSITYNNTHRFDTGLSGVMSLHYIPTIGYSVNKDSAINIAANGLYSAVRADNSGAKNYEPADLMKYLMAIDSAYSLWAFMARAYGVGRVYSHVNRYWPKGLLAAMHVDEEDLYANLSTLRYYLNVYAIKLNSVCAPSNMPIFKRHFWMCTGVWKDASNDKAQTYLFVPEYLFKYDETTTPAQLTATPVIGGANNRLKVSDMVDIMNQFIDPLLASEDVGIISGDLFKRFGLDGSFKLASVPETYEVYPVYSPEILSQIQNIRFIGVPILDSIHIRELTSQDGNAGALHQALNVQSGSITQNIAHPLNLDENLADTSPAAVMVASRLTTLGSLVKSDDAPFGYQAIIDVCGSEVCTQWELYRLDNGVVNTLFSQYTMCNDWTAKTSNSPMASESGGAYNVISGLGAVSAFNYHPIYFASINATYSSGKLATIEPPSLNCYVYDFDNYTVVGKTALRKLHESALLAEFNVPAMGQYR